MKTKVSVSGLRDLDANLRQLSKATARNTLRRVLIAAGQPIADTAAAMAPNDPATGRPDLSTSMVVGTKLNKRQQALHRRRTRDDKTLAEVFVGTNDPAAVQQEFGNARHGPQPFMRPAWDQQKGASLNIIVEELAQEIDKSVARMKRREARRAAR